MAFQEEFPDYPVAQMPIIPAGWRDTSWRNDQCPSFTAHGVQVFIDFADPNEREFPESPRFIVSADPEVHDHNEPLMETDDWQAVLDYVAAEKVVA